MLYCAVHSVLAMPAIKKVVGNQRLYRLVYSLLAVVGLMGILLYQATLPAQKFFEPNDVSQIAGLALGLVGIQLIRMAFKKHSFKAFIGLKKAGESPLITDGIYARLRHPLYTATLALGLGFLVFYPTMSIVVMLAVWVVYLPIGIKLEEAKLIATYGEAYRDYQKSTTALLPGIW